jgi:GntR family transcriptional regulator, transcriptional repressor for pyruvate dehydrogenase complex
MSVTDQAINEIKRMIVSGELKPGERLPKESELAARLGVSRNSLREAVRALTLVRILDVRQGDGTYVTALEPDMLSEALSFLVDFHQDRTVLDLLEVRRLLEPAATAIAAQRIGDQELGRLSELLDEMAACATVEAFVNNDLAFHGTIAASAGNPVLTSLLESLSGPTTRARIWRGLTQADAVDRTRAEHTAIYEALRRHRPDEARAWATIHVAGVQAWLELALEPEDRGSAAPNAGVVSPAGGSRLEQP